MMRTLVATETARAEDHRRLLGEEVVNGDFKLISWNGMQLFERVVVGAEIKPYKIDISRGDPDDVTPHALRHSVAYRMMNKEEGIRCTTFGTDSDFVRFKQQSGFTTTSIEFKN